MVRPPAWQDPANPTGLGAPIVIHDISRPAHFNLQFFFVLTGLVGTVPQG